MYSPCACSRPIFLAVETSAMSVSNNMKRESSLQYLSAMSFSPLEGPFSIRRASKSFSVCEDTELKH